MLCGGGGVGPNEVLPRIELSSVKLLAASWLAGAGVRDAGGCVPTIRCNNISPNLMS